MANSIDERIVEMQFDNKQFESGVKQTISSLDELKNSLKLDGVSKGFDEMDRAASKVRFDPIQNGIAAVSQGFSTMEIIAISALQRITNQVMSVGENLIKSFTIAPITSGWDKYEGKVASVQKILNSSADNTMPKVEAALEKIGWFTDETSYQFDQMVSTLGSFGSAGIKLETATDAIIGIANAAAISGVNASDASHAMLGFQRAIGSGYMSLGIWNSYLKTAGLQSQVFIDQCIKIGTEMNKLKKGTDGVARTLKGTEVTAASFSETLNEKWLDKDVLTKTLESFSVATNQLYDIADGYDTVGEAIRANEKDLDAFSLAAFKAGQETKTWGDTVEYIRGTVAQGWANTWELIFGNYEEATEFYSTIVEDLYKLFIVTGEARNEFLAGWKVKGRIPFIDGLINSLRIIVNIVERGRAIFSKLIPNDLIAKAVSLSESFLSLTVGIAKALGIEDIAVPVKETFEVVSEGISKVTIAGEEVVLTLEKIDQLAKAVIRGDYGSGQKRVEKLGEAYKIVQNRVNELLGSTFRYEDAQIKLSATNDRMTEKIMRLNEEYQEGGRQAVNFTRTIKNISSTFKGAVALFEIFSNLIVSVIRVVTRSTGVFAKLGDGILGITGSLGDIIVKARDFIEENDAIYETLMAIADAIGVVLKPAFDTFYDLMDKAAGRRLIPDTWLNQVQEFVKTNGGFSGILAKIGEYAKTAQGPVGNFLKEVSKAVTNTVSWFKENKVLETGLGLLALGVIEVSKAIQKYVPMGWSKIKETFSTVSDLFGIAKEWFTTFKLPSLKSSFKQFFENLIPAQGLPGIIKNFIRSFRLYKDGFIDLYNTLKSENEVFNKVATSIEKIFEKIKEYFKGFGTDLAFFYNTTLSPFLSPIVNTIKSFVDKIKKIDFAALTRIAILGTSLFFLFNLARLAGGVTKLMKSLSDVGGAIEGFIKSIKLSLNTAVILSFAAVIGVIGLCIYKLATIGQENLPGLILGGTMILAAMGIMYAILKLLSENTEGSARRSMEGAVAMLALAGSIALIVGALIYLTKLTEGQIIGGLFNMLLIFAEVVGMLWVVNKVLTDGGHLNPLSMVAFYVFIMGLEKSVKIVEDLALNHPFDQMVDGLNTLAYIAGILTVLSFGLSKMKFSSSFGALALVGAIWLFVKLLENLANADFGKVYYSLLAMSPVFIALEGLFLLVKHAGDSAKQAMAVMGVLALSVLLITESLKILGGLDPGTLIVGGLAIAVILQALIYATKQLSGLKMSFTKNSAENTFKFFAGMAVACLAISFSLRILAGIPFGKMMTAMIGLGGTLLAFGKACQLAGQISAKIGPIIAIAGAMLLITASLVLLTYLDQEALLSSALSLGMVIAAFGYAVGQLKTMKISSVIAEVVAMGILIVAIAASLYMLASIKDWASIIAAGGAISIVVLSLTALVPMIKKVKWGDAIGAAAAMGLLLIAIAGALRLLLEMGSTWEQMIASAIAVGLLLIELSAVVAIGNKIGATINYGAIVHFLGGVGIVLGAIIALALLFSIIAYDNLGKMILNGLDFIADVFEKIGQILGKLVGGIIDGFNTSSTKHIVEVGRKLKTFTDTTKDFTETFGNSKTSNWDSIVKNTASFGSALSNLGGASSRMTNYNFDNLSKYIKNLGQAMSLFWVIIKDSKMDVDKVKTAAEAIETLTSIVPPTAVEGDANAWSKAGEGLDAMGNALLSFGKLVSSEDVNMDDVSKAIGVIKELGLAVGAINTEGFEGWNKIAGVGEIWNDNESYNGLNGLQRLGIELMAFQNAIKGDGYYNQPLDTRLLMSTFADLKVLAEAAGMVPAYDSGFSWSTLVDNLVGREGEPGLAEALVAFGETSVKIVPSYVQRGVDAIKMIAESTSGLDIQKSGVIQWLSGDSSLGTFIDNLKSLGPAVAQFSNDVKAIKVTDSTGLWVVLDRLRERIPDLETMNLAGAGYQLQEFGTYLHGFYDSIYAFLGDGTDSDPMAGINSVISSIGSVFTPETVQALHMAGTAMATHVVRGMNESQELGGNISMFITTLTGLMVGDTSPNMPMYDSAGKGIAEAVSQALNTGDSYQIMMSEVNTFCTEMKNAIRDYYDEFKLAGSHLVWGIIAGMGEVDDIAIEKAGALGSNMNKAFKDNTGQKSPSKLWAQYARNLVSGLVIGIDSSQDRAVESARGLATALNGEFTGSAMSPRLTPVVDLSNATVQASRLNTMFDASRAAALSATMDINSQVSQMDDLVDMTSKILGTIQNGSDVFLDGKIITGYVNRRLGQA